MGKRFEKVNISYFEDKESGKRFNNNVKRKKISDNESQIIPYNSNSTFTKVFVNHMPKLSKIVYYGYFNKLLHRVEKYSNVLSVYKNNCITPASAEDLAKFIGVSINSFRKFLTEAKDLNVLVGTITTDGYGYTMNPAYAYNGKGIGVSLYLIFEKDRDFVSSLTINQINTYKQFTGRDYLKNIKFNFPDIYEKLISEIEK